MNIDEAGNNTEELLAKLNKSIGEVKTAFTVREACLSMNQLSLGNGRSQHVANPQSELANHRLTPQIDRDELECGDLSNLAIEEGSKTKHNDSSSGARHRDKCPLCGLDPGLRSHKSRCSRRRSLHFTCPSCRAPFSRQTELVLHMRRISRSKGGDPGPGDSKACPSCRLCRRSYGARGWGVNALKRSGKSTVFVEDCGFVCLD